MDSYNVIPLLLGHVEDHAIAEDTGAIDNPVESTEAIEGRPNEAFSRLHGADRIEVGDCTATAGFDVGDGLFRRTIVVAGPVHVDAGVIDDNVRPEGGGEHSDLASNTPTGTGNDDGLAVQQSWHLLLLARRFFCSGRSPWA